MPITESRRAQFEEALDKSDMEMARQRGYFASSVIAAPLCYITLFTPHPRYRASWLSYLGRSSRDR
ncbi:hypothetical protein BDV11DRAFT_187880 [Aspergillus similis]